MAAVVKYYEYICMPNYIHYLRRFVTIFLFSDALPSQEILAVLLQTARDRVQQHLRVWDSQYMLIELTSGVWFRERGTQEQKHAECLFNIIEVSILHIVFWE